jgi:citrate synthase
MVGSSRASLFASISAGISALWGPLHGGANQEVIEMQIYTGPTENSYVPLGKRPR